MAFDLFDKLLEYFTDARQETRAVLNIFDSSYQIPPWQIALSLSLFSYANALLSTLYHDSSLKHQNSLLPHVQLVENEQNYDLLRVNHMLSAFQTTITECQEQKRLLEDDLRNACFLYRLDACRHDDAGRIQQDLEYCQQKLTEHGDALPGLLKLREEAVEAHQKGVKARQEQLLIQICFELAKIGNLFDTFVTKLVPIVIKKKGDVDEVGTTLRRREPAGVISILCTVVVSSCCCCCAFLFSLRLTGIYEDFLIVL